MRLLVRDNGSSDGTAEAIRRDVSEAIVEAGPENLGFAAGMNRLLQLSDAPWFFPLNSDAWPEPGAIRRLVATGEEHPRAAAIAPRLERPDGRLEHSTHPFPSVGVAIRSTLPHYAERHPTRARELMLNGAWTHDEQRDVDWAVGAALLMRRSALDDIGPFDERLFMYAEDLDWCWRARHRGWTIRFEPQAVVRHIGNASGSQQERSWRNQSVWRNTYRVCRWTKGPLPTAAYRLANVVGASLAWWTSRRNPPGRAHYRRELRAHLSSTRRSDRPPGDS